MPFIQSLKAWFVKCSKDIAITPLRTFLKRSFFQFLNFVTQLSCLFEFFSLDRKQQFFLQPVDFTLALDCPARSLGYLADVYRIPMDSLEQRIQPIREMTVTGAASEPSELAELRVRQPALVASQILPIRLHSL
jgi:hypothetical protein